MIEILIALCALAVGAGIGYLVARKINNANYDFFVEQAKAKAKAIEFEAEGILRNSKISVQEAEFEAKKKYEDKANCRRNLTLNLTSSAKRSTRF